MPHSLSNSDLDRLLPAIVALARAAGKVVMQVYETDFDVRGKEDSSPVTEADDRAEAVILAQLPGLLPGIPVVSEEAAAAGVRPDISGGTYWLVDPVDGTKEFIKRNGEFTVNIALIENTRPVLGVVLAPALGLLYAGAPGGAWVQKGDEPSQRMRVRDCPSDGLTLMCSRSHRDDQKLEAWCAAHKVAARVAAGSSLKLCLLANAQADVYPRFGPTSEWDIAAGQAVLEAAGGRVLTLDGRPLAYGEVGKTGFRNPEFIAWGCPPV